MFRKNTASQFIHVQGVDATTGGIKSGVTWTVRRCIDGTFAAAGGTATEDGSTGWYKFALSQADTNGNNIGFNFTGTGAVPQTVNIVTTAADPTDGVRLGLTALPNAAAEAAGGLYTRGSGAGQIAQQANGQADVNLSTIKTQTVTAAAGVTFPASIASPTNITAGTITTVTNVTNAPTNGDLTAAMKASVNAEADTAIADAALATAANLAVVAGYIDTEVAAIKTQTDKLTFDGSNRVASNPTAINSDATAAANLAKATRSNVRGTVDAGASTTSIPTSACTPAGAAADQFKGRIITFDADTTTTALRGQATDITASSNAAAPTFTVTALTTAPSAGDMFSVT